MSVLQEVVLVLAFRIPTLSLGAKGTEFVGEDVIVEQGHRSHPGHDGGSVKVALEACDVRVGVPCRRTFIKAKTNLWAVSAGRRRSGQPFAFGRQEAVG